MVNEWELEWWNGDEYETCQMYSHSSDPTDVRRHFMSEVYSNETVENLVITHEGLVRLDGSLPIIDTP